MAASQTPVVSLRVPVTTLTGAAILLVPGVVLAGFAAAGALRTGVAPALIVALVLVLLHREVRSLVRQLDAARFALRERAATTAGHRKDVERLEKRIAAHDQELLHAQEVTAFALAKLVESRDPSTGVHLERVRSYAKLLAVQLGRTARYRATITERYATAIYMASPLHDIGKVAIPDSILLKPGKLTAEEFTFMKRHATLGGRTLRAAARRAANNLFLDVGHEIALYHHERWDASGYPFGLPGPQIPLAARIVALADVYDALTSKRCYKPAYSHEQARAYIVEQAGRHFDPEVVEAFLALEMDFVRIREALSGDLPLYSDELPEIVVGRHVLGAA